MSKQSKMVTNLGQLLRGLREARDQSLKDASGQMGIDMSLLGKLERNERQPTRDQVKALAKHYQVDEKKLKMELLTDQFASRIIDEELGLDTLRVAEMKVEYLKKNN